MTTTNKNQKDAISNFEESDQGEDFAYISKQLDKAQAQIGNVIFGQSEVVNKTLVTLLSGGHVLLIGVPGLAKTLLVETMAKVLGLSSGRIQCTPDLMPADIVGSEVLEEDEKGVRSFRFIPGPVFAQFVMADEINRATPRTQSALLQAMQENVVTVNGTNHPLPRPFHVLATQNPIEQEGTYPLPEAQLDRFLMQIDVSYPGADSEREMMLATTTGEEKQVSRVFEDNDLKMAQNLVHNMPVGESIVDLILQTIRKFRPQEGADPQINEFVQWGPGPRASQALMLSCRARALLDGRQTPAPEDVLSIAPSVLKHRMALNFKARSQGMRKSDLIQAMLKKL